MGFYETQEANYEYRKSMKESYNEGYKAGYEQGKKAVEIEFLERLYEKVEADMRGEQDECIENLPPVQPKPKTEKCKWVRYDYRTICPKNHDIDNPYWRIPEKTECLKYCPYCGKEIEVEK